MKEPTRMWASLMTAGLVAGMASAQGTPYPAHPAPAYGAPPCQPYPAVPPATGTTPQASEGAPPSTTPPAGTPEQGATSAGGTIPGLGGERSGFSQGNTISAGGGLGSATAMATGGMVSGAGLGATTLTMASITQTPLILPGLFTAISSEPARPADRLFLDYGYFDRFKVNGPTGIMTGFDLHRFDVGVEKTFLDCRASVYVRVPFLEATSNVTGQPIDGLGDVSAGVKFVLFADQETGSVLTGGFTVSAPTARDQGVTTFSLTNTMPPVFVTTTVNPTFLQPWVAALFAGDRLFVQDYLGVVIPTDDRVSTLINNDLSLGYQIYRCNGNRWLTSVAPTLDVQVLVPVNHRGSSNFAQPTIPNFVPGMTTVQDLLNVQPKTFGFSDQLFLTGGLQFGLGERTLLSTGVTTPLVGPRAFTVGATAGLNFFF